MFKLIVAFVLAAALVGCFTFYDVARQACMKKTSNDEMHDCLKHVQAAEEEFKRKSPALGKLEALPKEVKPIAPCSRRAASGEPPCAE